MAEGGRTGLTSVVTGVLIVVGFLMMRTGRDIPWTDFEVFHGKARKVHPFMYVVSKAFAVTFVLPLLQSLVD